MRDANDVRPLASRAPQKEWELLAEHLAAVGARAADFAAAFGWAEVARLAGRLHDIGKNSAEFQSYIRLPPADGARLRGPDHSTAGARQAVSLGPLGRMLAFAIAGHHAGLADGRDLDCRLALNARAIPSYAGWEALTGTLPGLPSLRRST